MDKPRTCFGWPYGKNQCDNRPIDGKYWCPECEPKRAAHLNKRFAEMERYLSREDTSG